MCINMLAYTNSFEFSQRTAEHEVDELVPVAYVFPTTLDL
jgi:hypothetical protein